MSCRAYAVVVVWVCAAPACVQSSGFEPPPDSANVWVFDGDELAFDSVTVERLASGEPYAERRLLRVIGVSGERVVQVELDSAAGGARPVSAFGEASLLVTDGALSERAARAVSGSVEVVDGTGALGERLTLELVDVAVRDTCTGAVQVIASANLSAPVSEAEIGVDEDFGYTGHAYGTVELGADFAEDDGAVLGIASSTEFVNSRGVRFLRLDTTDACLSRATKIGLVAAIDENDLPAPGTSSSLADHEESFAFMNLIRDNALFAQALVVDGTLTVSAPVAFELDAVVDVVFENLTLRYLDENDEFTTDAPAFIPRLDVRGIYGRPDLD